jgi:hypothetical protein
VPPVDDRQASKFGRHGWSVEQGIKNDEPLDENEWLVVH